MAGHLPTAPILSQIHSPVSSASPNSLALASRISHDSSSNTFLPPEHRQSFPGRLPKGRKLPRFLPIHFLCQASVSDCRHLIQSLAVIYPVLAHWGWAEQGWLHIGIRVDSSNFRTTYLDYAGAGVVHLCGGTISLVAAWMLGPRIGRFSADGNAQPIEGHSVPVLSIFSSILSTFAVGLIGWLHPNAWLPRLQRWFSSRYLEERKWPASCKVNGEHPDGYLIVSHKLQAFYFTTISVRRLCCHLHSGCAQTAQGQMDSVVDVERLFGRNDCILCGLQPNGLLGHRDHWIGRWPDLYGTF